jgi:aspartate/tyrosine/aromatic aminotransferase
VVTAQALGGTGALKIGADFQRLYPNATVASATRAGKTTARCSKPPASR